MLSQGSIKIRESERDGEDSGSRKFTPILAQKWERLARIRSRFRRGAGWLKFARGVKGDDIVQCTPTLSCNFEVLATALETCGLKLQSVKALEKEVGRLSLLFFSFPEAFSKVLPDAGSAILSKEV